MSSVTRIAVTTSSRKRTVGAKRKAIPQDGFGNDFGNEGVVLPPTLVIPIDLVEEVRFELTEDFHPRQFSRLVHSTALPLFLCELSPRL